MTELEAVQNFRTGPFRLVQKSFQTGENRQKPAGLSGHILTFPGSLFKKQLFSVYFVRF
jgi:hypothetical protein